MMLARTFLQTTLIGDTLVLVPDENVHSLDRLALEPEQTAVSLTLQQHAPQVRHAIVDLSSLTQLTSPLIETLLTVSTERGRLLRSFTLCHLRAEMSRALEQLQLLDAPHRPGNWRVAPTRFAAFKTRDQSVSADHGPQRISAASASRRADISVFTIAQEWPVVRDYGIAPFRLRPNMFHLLVQDTEDEWLLIRQRTSPKSRSHVPRTYRRLTEEMATAWLNQNRDEKTSRSSTACAPRPVPTQESVSSPLPRG